MIVDVYKTCRSVILCKSIGYTCRTYYTYMNIITGLAVSANTVVQDIQVHLYIAIPIRQLSGESQEEFPEARDGVRKIRRVLEVVDGFVFHDGSTWSQRNAVDVRTKGGQKRASLGPYAMGN